MRPEQFMALLLAFCNQAKAFYVPGVAPTDFRKGDKITVKAIKMTSSHTQLPVQKNCSL